jgi:hypothetical protein
MLATSASILLRNPIRLEEDVCLESFGQQRSANDPVGRGSDPFSEYSLHVRVNLTASQRRRAN